MSTTTTDKELALLKQIATSEYQDGADIVDNPVWLDYLVNSKSHGGVLTSLQNKGLVTLKLVSRADSDNYRNSGITDSTVAITQAGADALKS